MSSTNYRALSTLTTVFFFWGFIASSNTIFIPFCKEFFNLDQFQSQLIDFAFYGAYYLGALLLFLISAYRRADLVGEWGYKKTIVLGLLFSAFGAGVMVFSVYINVFSGMLLGLFIVALGFSLQQTSANPFMILLGDERSGSTRITLGGAVNSFGTTIGPLIISLALFGATTALTTEQIKEIELSKVCILYACVAILFLLIAILFKSSKNVPTGKIKLQITLQSSQRKAITLLLLITCLLIICFIPVFYSYRSNFNYPAQQTELIRFWSWLLGLLILITGLLYAYTRGKKVKLGWGAMQYPQLSLGMLAIFVYVGVEVSIGSNLGELLQRKHNFDTTGIAPYVSMYWGSLMIGRWTGAIAAINLSNKTKKTLRFIVPLIAFGIILVIGYLCGYDVSPLKWYIICVIVQILASHFTNDRPILTLGVFSLLGILSLFLGIFTDGTLSIYLFLSGGLFCSIMWPCIFSLSLAGLGKYQSQGSTFLVMMILGGAIIPPLQGKLADMIDIQSSFIVGIICFAYLAIFAFVTRNIFKIQNIEF